MSAKTHFPKKVTFTDSGTYVFWGNPLPVGPSSSLFQPPLHFLPLFQPSLHPVTQNGSPLSLLELMSLFPHTLTPLLVLFSPRILRGPLSPPQVFALLPLSQRSLSLNMVLNTEVPSPPPAPHTPQGPASPFLLALLVFRIGLLSAGHPLGVSLVCLPHENGLHKGRDLSVLSIAVALDSRTMPDV